MKPKDAAKPARPSTGRLKRDFQHSDPGNHGRPRLGDGDHTCPGGNHAQADSMHRVEDVWSQSDISRADGVGVVEAMRLGKRGYSSGGVVGMPFVPTQAAGSGVEINIHAPVGTQAEQKSRRGTNGREIIDVFIKEAVGAVAGQLATDSGPVGQAMRTRRNLGM